MSDMLKSVISIAFGWLLAGLLGFMAFQIIQSQILSTGWHKEFAFLGGTFGFLGILLYVGYFGMQNLHFLENGVPLIIGQRLSFYIIPPGRSWWFPSPLGEIFKVYIGQKTLDRRNSTNNPISHVLSADRLEVGVSLLVQYSVSDPYSYSTLENPESAFEGLIDRNVRWYVSLNEGEEMPSKRDELASMISGKIQKEDDGNGNMKQYVVDKDGNWVDTENHVVATAHDWGIKINYVLADDINLPKDLIAAYEQERVEIRQQSYESTETETVIALMKKYRLGFPNLTDREILNAVQVERKKAKRILLEGNAAGDFTRGGYLSGQGGNS